MFAVALWANGRSGANETLGAVHFTKHRCFMVIERVLRVADR